MFALKIIMKIMRQSLNKGIIYKIKFYAFLYFVISIKFWTIYCSENSCLEIDCANQIAYDVHASYPKSLKKQTYSKFHETILQMKRECGDLCEPTFIDIANDIPDGKTFKKLEKSINCNNLWNDSIFDQPNEFDEPLQILPKYLRDHFSRNGRVKISPHYLVDTTKEDDQFIKWGKLILYFYFKSYEIRITL